MKNHILLFLLTIISFTSFSQKMELGKVSIEELQEKTHPKDSSAVAAILFKKGEVRFEYSQENGFDMITVIKTRIKIYKKEGYDYANYMQRYYIGSNAKETVSFDDANTYNLVAGKIEKTKLKSDGIFDEKINKFWNRKKITMPNIKEGSIIEFECTIKSDGIGTIDEWEFQTDIPVNYSQLKTNIPEYFVYNPSHKGFISPKIEVEKNSKTIKYSYREAIQPGESVIKSTTQEELNFTETNTTYIAQNMPSMKDESYVNNIKNYTSSVSHELTQIRYPNQPFKSYSTNWEKVTKTIYDSDDFGSELNKTGYFEEELASILKNDSSRDEKIAIIYTYVKNKVKWNNYTSYYCNEGVKNAYKNGTGNVAEINLMLTAMLRFANIDANPVLVSTRDNGITYFPNLYAFNYVIAAVEIDNGLLLLDATSKNALPNILPIRDLNWFGRLIRKDGTSAQVNLTPTNTSRDIVSVMATINTDGSVEGKAREQHLDYNAFTFREIYGDLAQESYLEKLEKNRENIEISDYTVTGKKEITEPVTENYSFKHNNSVEIIGDKMYFSPMLFFAEKENPFKQETREYPVDFIYPNQEKYMINITIPDGYSVETLPKSVSIPMSDNILGLKYILSNTENKIQLSLNFDVNTAIISSDYYDELKAVYTEIIKKETEKIVLKKI